MGSMISRAKRFKIARFKTGIVALVLLNLQFLNIWLPKLQLDGMRGICGPVFFCHSCPWATMACPLGVLVNFSTLKIFPFIAVGILGLVGVIGGRLVCGWICPFGWLQDLLYKIRTPKISIPARLCYIKYAILVIFVVAVPYFLPGKPYNFCSYCPSATLESTIPWAFMGVNSGYGVQFYTRIAILIGVLALATVASRGFCRTMCPLGAIFAMFNRFSIFRFRLAHGDCNNCKGCGKNCPVEIDPVGQMNTAECIRCMDCTAMEHLKLGVK